jgi:preprotein translocase subunit YajC
MNKSKTLVWGLMGIWLISAIYMVFIGGCVPQEEPPAEEGGFDWTIILFLVLMFVIVYFLIIRPQRKRQKEHEELSAELKRGDKVITAGGIYGQIESVSDDSVVLKVESGATMRVARNSITTRRKQ